ERGVARLPRQESGLPPYCSVLAHHGASQERQEQPGVKAVSLRSPLLARHRNTGRVDYMGLYPSSAQPPGEPEPILICLECHQDPVDRVTRLYRSAPPSSQESQETVRVGLLLL